MTDRTSSNTSELLAFPNPDKVPGDKSPAFNGFLKLHGEPGDRPLSLWVKRRTNGHILLCGCTGKYADAQMEERLSRGIEQRVTQPTATALVAFNTEISVEPQAIVLFRNTRKTKDTPMRPAYLGYYNPGSSGVLMRVAVWTRSDRRGRPFLVGSLEPDAPYRGSNEVIVPYTYAHAEDDAREVGLPESEPDGVVAAE
ncbi:MAG: hypothetical protein AB7E81_04495 [Hyphomicrobiaceae bacterium]